MNNSNNKQKNLLLKGVLLTGTVIGLASVTPVQSNNLFNFENLGSAHEIRADILNNSIHTVSSQVMKLELKCGEEGTKTKAPSKNKEAKTKTNESKCGEGKCGEETETKTTKAEKKTTTKTTKTTENKCGEGKCGIE